MFVPRISKTEITGWFSLFYVLVIESANAFSTNHQAWRPLITGKKLFSAFLEVPADEGRGISGNLEFLPAGPANLVKLSVFSISLYG